MYNKDKDLDVTYAVAYCRYSSNNQREESIDAQLRAIREYAQNNNIVIIGEYCDSAMSGTNADRKEFQRMISDSSKKRFSLVLVHKLDRFSRDRDDTISYKVALKRNGVKVFSVTERFDDSPEGILIEAVVEGIAAYYSKNLSRETMKGMKENAYNSKFNGSRPPYGYKLVPRKDKDGNIEYSKKRGTKLHDLALDEKNHVAVQKIFDMTLERKTYPEIIKYLKENGYTMTSGKEFSTSTLLQILKNERYTGTYIFNQTCRHGNHGLTKNKPEDVIRNENAFPAIITKEKFHDVQKLLAARAKKHPGIKIEDYLLSGKIFCGECLNVYIGERRKKRRANNQSEYYLYYRCKGSHIVKGEKIKAECHNGCINKDKIESFVINQISKLIFSDKNFDNIFEYYETYKLSLAEEEHSVNNIKKEIEKVQSKLKNIWEAIAIMGYKEELGNQVNILEQRKDKLNQDLQIAQAYKFPKINKEKVKYAYKMLRQKFENSDLPNMKELIDIFVNKVVVYRDRLEIYLNIIPSLFCEDYGLDVDNLIIERKGEDDNDSSSLSNKKCRNIVTPAKTLGSPGRIRTYDLSVNSRALHH